MAKVERLLANFLYNPGQTSTFMTKALLKVFITRQVKLRMDVLNANERSGLYILVKREIKNYKKREPKCYCGLVSYIKSKVNHYTVAELIATRLKQRLREAVETGIQIEVFDDENESDEDEEMVHPRQFGAKGG